MEEELRVVKWILYIYTHIHMVQQAKDWNQTRVVKWLEEDLCLVKYMNTYIHTYGFFCSAGQGLEPDARSKVVRGGARAHACAASPLSHGV